MKLIDAPFTSTSVLLPRPNSRVEFVSRLYGTHHLGSYTGHYFFSDNGVTFCRYLDVSKWRYIEVSPK